MAAPVSCETRAVPLFWSEMSSGRAQYAPVTCNSFSSDSGPRLMNQTMMRRTLIWQLGHVFKDLLESSYLSVQVRRDYLFESRCVRRDTSFQCIFGFGDKTQSSS